MKHVLCVKREIFETHPLAKTLFQFGMMLQPIEAIPQQLMPLGLMLRHLEFVERDAAEKDPSYLQLIPYAVAHAGSTLSSNTPVIVYTRGGAEARLHAKNSCGFGGHIDMDDSAECSALLKYMRETHQPDDTDYAGTVLQRYIYRNLVRELEEELQLDMDHPSVQQAQLQGFIFSHESKELVQQVHLGVVYAVPGIEIQNLAPRSEECGVLRTHACKDITFDNSYEDWSPAALRVTLLRQQTHERVVSSRAKYTAFRPATDGNDPMYAPSRDVGLMHQQIVSDLLAWSAQERCGYMMDCVEVLAKAYETGNAQQNMASAEKAFFDFVQGIHNSGAEHTVGSLLVKSGWLNVPVPGRIGLLALMGTYVMAQLYGSLRQMHQLGKSPSKPMEHIYPAAQRVIDARLNGVEDRTTEMEMFVAQVKFMRDAFSKEELEQLVLRGLTE